MFFNVGLHGMRNIANTIADFGLGYTQTKRFFGDSQELFTSWRNLPHRNGDRIIANIAFVFDNNIESDDVTVMESTLKRADTMNDLFINGEAGIRRKPA